MRWLLLFILAFSPAYAVDIASKRALIIDIDSQSTLLQKKAEEPFKAGGLITLFHLHPFFEAVKLGEISLATPLTISDDAWKIGGGGALMPSLYLKSKEKVTLENLIKGLAVSNGKDASHALKEAFLQQKSLNEAQALKLIGQSCTLSLPAYYEEKGEVTLKNAALCGVKLVRKYPEMMAYFKNTSLKRNDVTLFNQNALAKQGLGLAMGKTDDGYSLIGTYQNLLVAISGAATLEQAEKDAFALLNWGRDGFELVKLYKENSSVGEILLAGYEKPSVKGRVLEAVDVLMSQGEKPYLISQIAIKQPFAKKKPFLNWFETLEPIKKGEVLGMLQLISNNQLLKELPIVSDETVEALPFYKRLFAK